MGSIYQIPAFTLSHPSRNQGVSMASPGSALQQPANSTFNNSASSFQLTGLCAMSDKLASQLDDKSTAGMQATPVPLSRFVNWWDHGLTQLSKVGGLALPLLAEQAICLTAPPHQSMTWKRCHMIKQDTWGQHSALLRHYK